MSAKLSGQAFSCLTYINYCNFYKKSSLFIYLFILFLGEKIKNRWVNIRDAFVRSLKGKSGQAAKKSYIYHDHLMFLLATQEPSQTESSTILDENTDVNDSLITESQKSGSLDGAISEEKTINKERKRPRRNNKELTYIENEIINELKRPRVEEPKCQFFTSFENYLTDMSESEKLELHMRILQSITEIKSKRTQNVFIQYE